MQRPGHFVELFFCPITPGNWIREVVADTGSINVDSTESDIALIRISTCMIHLPLKGQVVTRLKGIRSEKYTGPTDGNG